MKFTLLKSHLKWLELAADRRSSLAFRTIWTSLRLLTSSSSTSWPQRVTSSRVWSQTPSRPRSNLTGRPIAPPASNDRLEGKHHSGTKHNGQICYLFYPEAVTEELYVCIWPSRLHVYFNSKQLNAAVVLLGSFCLLQWCVTTHAWGMKALGLAERNKKKSVVRKHRELPCSLIHV